MNKKAKAPIFMALALSAAVLSGCTPKDENGGEVNNSSSVSSSSETSSSKVSSVSASSSAASSSSSSSAVSSSSSSIGVSESTSQLPTQSTDPATSDVPAQPKPEQSSKPVASSSSSSSSSSKPVQSSSSKPVSSSSSSSKPVASSSIPFSQDKPKKGDIKIENGEKFVYDDVFGWIPKGNGGGMTGDNSHIDPTKGSQIGHM